MLRMASDSDSGLVVEWFGCFCSFWTKSFFLVGDRNVQIGLPFSLFTIFVTPVLLFLHYTRAMLRWIWYCYTINFLVSLQQVFQETLKKLSWKTNLIDIIYGKPSMQFILEQPQYVDRKLIFLSRQCSFKHQEGIASELLCIFKLERLWMFWLFKK